MMKLLLLFGSPRKHGHTATLVDAFTEVWPGEIVRVDAYRTLVHACTDCRACWETKTPHCVIDDDMQRVYRQIDEADRFLIATPVYFFGLPAPLKALIDRGQCYWAHMHFQHGIAIRGGRKAGAILVGGAPSYAQQFDGILGGMKHWLSDQRTELVGVVKKSGSDLHPSANDHETLEACRALALKLL